jgi:hypothetical protein
MDVKILAIYCVCADLLKAIGHMEDPQQQISDAEVITTGLVAMLCFRGNCESARALLSAPRYIPHMLSRSRLNRRLHRLNELFLTLFELLGHRWKYLNAKSWKYLNAKSVYIIDSFPVAVCDNYQIPRANLYRHEQYRGYISSKKRYFYRLKVHLMVTKGGQPVEYFLTPGSYSDVCALKRFRLNVLEGSSIYGDRAYNLTVRSFLDQFLTLPYNSLVFRTLIQPDSNSQYTDGSRAPNKQRADGPSTFKNSVISNICQVLKTVEKNKRTVSIMTI